MSETYTLTRDGAAIQCHICGLESADPFDVQQRCCPFCHRWHSAPLPTWCDCPSCGQHRARPWLDGQAGYCAPCALPLIAFGGTWWPRPHPVGDTSL